MSEAAPSYPGNVRPLHPVSDSPAVPRCPDELLAADMPDWMMRVWLALRKVQGNNTWAWAKDATIGELCSKPRSTVSEAKKALEEGGWIERKGRQFRCLIGADSVASPYAERGRTAPKKPAKSATKKADPSTKNVGDTDTSEAEKCRSHRQQMSVTPTANVGPTDSVLNPASNPPSNPETPIVPLSGDGVCESGSGSEETDGKAAVPAQPEADGETPDASPPDALAEVPAGDPPPEPEPPDLWDDFWAAYPVKRSKTPARKKWKAKGLHKDPDRARAIIADVERRVEHDAQWRRGYPPHPSTYLNQERWTDELSIPESAPDPSRLSARERASLLTAADAGKRLDGALEILRQRREARGE